MRRGPCEGGGERCLPFLGVVRVSGSLQRVPVQYKRRYRKLVPSTGTGKGAFPGRGTRSCCMYGYRVRRTGAGTGTTYDLSIPDYRVGTYSYFLLSTVAVELVLVKPPVRFFRSRQNRNRNRAPRPVLVPVGRLVLSVNSGARHSGSIPHQQSKK